MSLAKQKTMITATVAVGVLAVAGTLATVEPLSAPTSPSVNHHVSVRAPVLAAVVTPNSLYAVTSAPPVVLVATAAATLSAMGPAAQGATAVTAAQTVSRTASRLAV